MRIRAGDPHDPRWLDARVFVDGLLISHCVEADTAEGWADILATDDVGTPLLVGDAFKTIRLTGRVAVTFP